MTSRFTPSGLSATGSRGYIMKEEAIEQVLVAIRRAWLARSSSAIG
jgi:hypothetical protein